ncbi:LamG domain-containing protein [Sphingomonas hengshuiensis]|uniref:hypothetical protein n=1 Tax=Sphingomonas hengshuiensis TaxID=1609977 RepID=UPI000A4B0115|nr:hypothetical protein [Sphingomonas hengshuiensis]
MHPAVRQLVLDRMTPRRLLGASLIAHWSATRPDLMELDGAAIRSWTDMIAGYKVTQTTAGFKPIWSPNSYAGFPGAGFDGTDDYVELTPSPLFSGSAPYEVWTRVMQPSLADTGTLVVFSSGGTSASNSRRVQKSVPAGVNRAGINVPDGTTNTTVRDDGTDFSGGPFVIRSVFADGANAVQVNGGPLVTGTGRLAGTGNVRLRFGASSTSIAGAFWPGVIADVLVMQPLTANQAVQLTRLLR